VKEAEERSREGRPRPSWLVAPALLVAVALLQLWLVQTRELSPWLGGGFGMFATVDSRSERHLVLLADSPGLVREVALPDRLRPAAERARALPTAARLRELAAGVAEAERARIPGLESVRLQLWRRSFAAGTLAPTERLHREVEVRIEQDGD
jgi:hypothetical protein